MAFFIPLPCSTLCEFYSITSPVLFNKNNKLWNKGKEDFLYSYFNVSYYWKLAEKRSFRPIAFLDTHVSINNPSWQSRGIVIFLCKFYMVIADTLISFWRVFLAPEAVYQRCSVKRLFLNILPNSQQNKRVRVSFLLTLLASDLQLYQKRDSITGFFSRNTSGGCFACCSM